MGRLLSIGRISKLYGLTGEVTINLYDNFPDSIDIEEPLYVRVDSLAVPLFMDSFERRGRRRAQVLFADLDSQRRAEEFIGAELHILLSGDDGAASRAMTSDDGELLLEDLVGYDAIIRDSGELSEGVRGRISGFIDSEMNPLWEVELEGERVGSGDESRYLHGRRVLIPAVDHFVVGIDTHDRIVELSTPEGLLDL